MHILGVSSLAAAHLTLVPELKAELTKHGRGDIMIVVGGVVPPQDYEALKKAGAEAIFPPGTVIAEAAEGLLHALNKRLGHYEGRGGVITRRLPRHTSPSLRQVLRAAQRHGEDRVGRVRRALGREDAGPGHPQIGDLVGLAVAVGHGVRRRPCP